MKSVEDTSNVIHLGGVLLGVCSAKSNGVTKRDGITISPTPASVSLGVLKGEDRPIPPNLRCGQVEPEGVPDVEVQDVHWDRRQTVGAEREEEG